MREFLAKGRTIPNVGETNTKWEETKHQSKIPTPKHQKPNTKCRRNQRERNQREKPNTKAGRNQTQKQKNPTPKQKNQTKHQYQRRKTNARRPRPNTNAEIPKPEHQSRKTNTKAETQHGNPKQKSFFPLGVGL